MAFTIRQRSIPYERAEHDKFIGLDCFGEERHRAIIAGTESDRCAVYLNA